MKTYFIIVLLISIFSCKNVDNIPLIAQNEVSEPKPGIDLNHLREKAKEANRYCKTKNLNTDFYILIDLKRHSGLKRFYIWDFKKDSIADAFLVSHGCGEKPWAKDYSKEMATVSNTEGSHASSVGKYIIGDRGYSNWGIHVNYQMHGQDKTNNNAFKRQIVLHSWEEVTDEEIFPDGTAEGWGCPALSNVSMRIVDEKLKKSDKKVLLWVVQ